ncbi:MAG: YkgJ family cysteine cluster protein [Oscillospiraceae bacterium]|nr:YkgJ family cysteine cluster protein [Oscillospiraceae bacterium]
MNRAEPVRPKDWVTFRCQLCGNCCRDLENQLMLEPLDAYHLARLLRERGEVTSIDDVYTRYAHTDMLEGYLPIYTMNTEGPDHACVFLKDGRCSVYEGRPHVCRIYPFSVRPGQRGRVFEFYRCVDQHAGHFSGDRIQVKDWLRENFTRENREFWAAEGNTLPILGRLLSSLGAGELRASLFQILHYRYYSYDLDKPFMPQYKANMAALERLLRQKLGEV